ncbi:MAG: hypothetical protein UT24_C0041G0007 [Candidatus Woesebacteria bacterium GW2011_GWB1_39_12]|uniref:Uncharacterized protein n=1 Tax=Candidatus Woesebacteria bacterium GW2011_GWB1_39_12 TaxID=1618574 RepID=A0A0G0M444_9BACT|nr:MAG: hypothetical protein UT24_C0041G0007 [Candidatus Woesebacteria bacterium GW2011_GWB1_39_12]
MSLQGFRYISPSVFDLKNNIYLLVEDFSMNAKISHSNVPLIGGTFGLTLEDIDDLERTFNFSAPIMLPNYKDKQPNTSDHIENPKIGFVNTKNSYHLCDLYYWLKTKNVYYQNISKLDLNIGKTSKISVDMMTTSPIDFPTTITPSMPEVVTTYSPDFQIKNEGRPSFKEIGDISMSGRSLNNYDVKLVDTDRNLIANSYLSDLSFSTKFDWKTIKSIPTYTEPEPAGGVLEWEYSYQNSNTGSTLNTDSYSKVPIAMKVLNTISFNLKYTFYIDIATLQKYSSPEGAFVVGLHNKKTPINIAITSATPPSLTFSDMISGIMDKWVDFQNTEWRLIDNSIQMTKSDIVKVSQNYNSVYQYNPVFGMRNISN